MYNIKLLEHLWDSLGYDYIRDSLARCIALRMCGLPLNSRLGTMVVDNNDNKLVSLGT